MNWIASGHTLLIVHDAVPWLDYLHDQGFPVKPVRMELASNWLGGNFFVKDHPLFRDLPVNTAFNWEYQVLGRYSASRFSILLDRGEAVVGALSREDTEIGTAVGIIPWGEGRIIYSTLDILPNLASTEEAAVVARRILMNFLEYATGTL